MTEFKFLGDPVKFLQPPFITANFIILPNPAISGRANEGQINY